MATYSQSAVFRKRISVTGIVQGVGLRPFVYNLARTLHLTGYVLNSSSGVTIEIEGSESALDHFVDQLRASPPPLSRIQEIATVDLATEGYQDFVIRESVAKSGEFVLVSPDMGTCDDCWHDFGDPSDRRFGYPFTNCTNCGPRYTIIKDIPYDRPSTTMARFEICEACRSEYEDPTNRPFMRSRMPVQNVVQVWRWHRAGHFFQSRVGRSGLETSLSS